MNSAFVLLKCDDGAEKQVLEKIKTLEEVKETQETLGPYGAVIRIESDNEGKIQQILDEKICSLSGIRSSVTLMTPFDNSNNESRFPWDEISGLSWIFFDEYA